ncbi:MAG TPA: HAD hydrolase family protein [Mycobacteriales bacterium]|nr:HAD hydrolase family protein [Mycobacteriales bacterium]
MPAAVVYSDLDGTMVGPRGCFVRQAGGATTLEPAQALVELHDAGVPLVLVSGRSRIQLMEAGAIFGADGFVAEIGGLVAWRGDDTRYTWQSLPAAGPPIAPALLSALLEQFPDLAVYEPYNEGHEVDVLLRGFADIAEVEAWLAARAAPHLRLRDNGLLPRNMGHAWHLIPDGVSKGAAVAWDIARRGIEKADTIAVGDSFEDLGMAPHVGRFFLCRNGLNHPGFEGQSEPDLPDNVTVTERPLGLGWVEAVHAALQ